MVVFIVIAQHVYVHWEWAIVYHFIYLLKNT